MFLVVNSCASFATPGQEDEDLNRKLTPSEKWFIDRGLPVPDNEIDFGIPLDWPDSWGDELSDWLNDENEIGNDPLFGISVPSLGLDPFFGIEDPLSAWARGLASNQLGVGFDNYARPVSNNPIRANDARGRLIGATGEHYPEISMISEYIGENTDTDMPVLYFNALTRDQHEIFIRDGCLVYPM